MKLTALSIFSLSLTMTGAVAFGQTQQQVILPTRTITIDSCAAFGERMSEDAQSLFGDQDITNVSVNAECQGGYVQYQRTSQVNKVYVLPYIWQSSTNGDNKGPICPVSCTLSPPQIVSGDDPGPPAK